MKRYLVLLVLVLSVIPIVSATFPSSAYEHTIIRGADRLLETQNDDGGWDWMDPDTNTTAGVPSPSNTIGVTAQDC